MTNFSQTNQSNNHLTPEDSSRDTPIEQSEQRLEPQSPKEQSLINKNIVNKVQTFPGVKSDFDTNQALALVNAIKKDLEQVGDAVKPESLEKVLHLEKWAEELQTRVQVSQTAATEQYLKHERQWLLGVVHQIRQSEKIDVMLNTVVTEIRQHLQADRVLIYRFESKDQGTVLAESMLAGYTPSLGELLPAIAFGADNQQDYQEKQVVALNYIYQTALSYYQLQLLEKFQVKASLSLPIVMDGNVWGLLVAQQCSGLSRRWQESEISLLYQIITELTVVIQAEAFRTQTQKQVEQEIPIVKIIDKIRNNPNDKVTIFQTATRELRQHLKCDRVAIYHFNPDWSGEFVAESVAAGWISLIQAQDQDAKFNSADLLDSDRCTVKNMQYPSIPDADTHLKETQGGSFVRGKQFKKIDNIYGAGFSRCYLETLEKFQAKAYVIVPIFLDEKLWGLLAAYQNVGPRQWQDYEVKLLTQMGMQMGVAIKQAEYLEQLKAQSNQIAKTADRERSLAKVIDKIRNSSDIDTIFRTAVQEVRKLLGVERVTIYKFRPDYFGDFVVESESGGLPRLVGSGWEDPYLQEHHGGRFRYNETLIVDDIYNAGLTDCHVEALEIFDVKACAVVAIMQGQKLWGLLSAFQHSSSRHWEEYEEKLLTQVGGQLGLAIQRAEYLQQLQETSTELAKSAEREQSAAKVIDKIRNSLDIDTIFQTTTQEVRKLLDLERIAIYKFRPDYFGDFVFESQSGGWSKLVGSGWENSYLQETQGGRFRHNEPLVLDDIYNAEQIEKVNLIDSHVEALKYFGVKACVLVAIMQGQKLWGLLCAVQHSGSRHWEEGEVKVLTQIGGQLGLALQRANYLQQLEDKNTQLAKIAERERAVAKVIDKIRNSLDINVIFKTTTQDVRKLLNVERITIYKFRSDYFGDFVVESESGGLPKLVGSAWEDTYVQEHQGGRFRDKEPFVVDDIYNGSLSDCHVEVLELFGIKSCAVVAIMQGQKLWGLLSAFQHSAPRHWEESEVNVMTQIGDQLGVALQQAEYIEELRTQSARLTLSLERGTVYSKLVYRIGLALIQDNFSLDKIFQMAIPEVRRQLQTDRVAIYRFNPDWSGEFVIEDVGGDWIKIVGTDLAKIQDTYLQETNGGRYRRRETFSVDNIYTVGYDECHIQLQEQWGTKAYMIAPIFKGDQLWGLLGAYQNDKARHWEQADINLLAQVGLQLGLALQQAEYLEKLRFSAQQLTEVGTREKGAKERLQMEVIQLLSAVRPALKGDLTVRARVTESEVGTVADAYNNTLQSLRQIIKQVQTASRKVVETSLNSESSISGLASEAQQQYQSLSQALEQIETMVNSTLAVETNAQEVEAAVQQTNKTVRTGDAAMNRTVDGIIDIRETVAETSKRLARLSESSQKVSKVVNLISSFTTQTQILALNAAIEATRAGEYGRGFGVVADEVRSLARRSADATTEIEQLVQNIQEGTAEVSTALEKSIQQVAEGTEMVHDVRENLTAIVEATSQISQLVEGITQSTQTQTQQFKSVTETMDNVAKIANKTSEDSLDISTSFKELLEMAQNLQTSADQFKVD